MQGAALRTSNTGLNGNVGLLPTPAYPFLRAQKGVSPKRAPVVADLATCFCRTDVQTRPYGLKHVHPFVRLNPAASAATNGFAKTEKESVEGHAPSWPNDTKILIRTATKRVPPDEVQPAPLLYGFVLSSPAPGMTGVPFLKS